MLFGILIKLCEDPPNCPPKYESEDVDCEDQNDEPKLPYPGDDPTEAPEGFEWRGRPGSEPGDDEGNYYNPDTDESLHPDIDHDPPIGPHWDYKDKKGDWYRIFPDGTHKPK